MYPDLSYFLHDLFGTAPDNALSIFKTFGMFLIVAFISSAYVLNIEFKRKEKEGILKGKIERTTIGLPATWQQITQNALLGFVLGLKIPYIILNFAEFQQDPAGVVFSSKGTLLWAVFLGVVMGYYRYWDAKRKQLSKPQVKEELIMPHHRIGDITMIAAVTGVIGAKLFSILESEENIRSFIKDPLEQLLSGDGLAIYGGLLLAFTTLYIYVKRKGMHPMHVMDAAAPPLILGYAVGRIGCQLSGDGDWGIENTLPPPNWWVFPDWAWSFTYPHNVMKSGIPIEGCEWLYCNELSPGVFPTPIYETFFGLVIFSILWVLRKRIKITGVLFFLYVFLNGVERFFIEKIRTNPDITIAGIEATQAEYIAFLLILTGLAGMGFMWYKSRTR